MPVGVRLEVIGNYLGESKARIRPIRPACEGRSAIEATILHGGLLEVLVGQGDIELKGIMRGVGVEPRRVAVTQQIDTPSICGVRFGRVLVGRKHIASL